MPTLQLHGVSSMATRLLLAELASDYARLAGVETTFESIGGVDAAKRVQAGEAFDLVVMASDAIETFIAGGSVEAGSRVDLVHSRVAVAVKAGAPRPDIGSEDAVKRAVRAARTIGYSTGPSGVQIARLFERWGLTAEIAPRLVVAPSGVPVGTLMARGEVALGFQQLSELIAIDGIDVIGVLPSAIEIVTTFSAGVCSASPQPEAARALIGFLASPAAAAAKRRHGMDPA